MKILALISAVGSLLLVSACASVPMASKEEDANAKTFKARADAGRIYVYRNESLGGAVKIPITLDGKVVGSTASKTYFALDVPPGSHDVGCIGETSSNLKVDVAAGKSVYVWQEMKMGMWAASCAMNSVDEQTGQKCVSECALAKSN